MKQTNLVTTEELKKQLSTLEDSLEKRIDKKVNKKIEASEKRLRMEIQLTGEDVVRQIDEKLIDFRSFILTTVDPLLNELETRREDRELATKQTHEIKKRLDDHEKRLQKLEKN